MSREYSKSGRWLECEDGGCLYAEESTYKLKSDPPRCIRHGAILTHSYDLYGCRSRSEAEDKRSQRPAGEW